MPVFDPAALTHVDRYRLSIGTVVPRPIAWITTCEADGQVNLAPFSFFTGVCASPLTIVVSIAERDPIKDTLRNIQRSGEAVVHLVPPGALAAMSASSAEFSPGLSEITELGLDVVPSLAVRPPRLALADIALECQLASSTAVGEAGRGTTLVLLTVVRVHVADSVADADGFPDPHRLRTVARLGGSSYLDATQWDVVDVPRAKPPVGKGVRG